MMALQDAADFCRKQRDALPLLGCPRTAAGLPNQNSILHGPCAPRSILEVDKMLLLANGLATPLAQRARASSRAAARPVAVGRVAARGAFCRRPARCWHC